MLRPLTMVLLIRLYVRYRTDDYRTMTGRRMHDRPGSLAEEQRMLLDTAMKALDTFKVGNDGWRGATGNALGRQSVEIARS